MVEENGIPKGMKVVLEERGVESVGMKAKEMRELLKTLPDLKKKKKIRRLRRKPWSCVHLVSKIPL